MADVHVRPARPGDVPDLAAVQRRVWRESYAQLVPPAALEALTSVEAELRWGTAVGEPPSPRHLVLVAFDGADLVGLGAAAPTDDADLDPGTTSEVLTLLVLEEARGRGHGSRLLAALADLQGERGTAVLTTWLFAADSAGQAFFGSAGWEPDGATRDLDVGGALVPMLRLHTRLPG